MLWRLLRFLRPQRGLAVAALALSFLSLTSQVALLGTSAYLISRAALRPPTLLLLMVPIVGVQLFSIARSSLRYLERYTSHDVTFRLLSNLRVFFFARIERLPPEAIGRFHSGDLLSRAVHDVESLQDLYLRAIAPPVVLALVAVLVWSVISPLAPPVGHALAIALLLTLVPAALELRIGRRLGEAVAAERAQLSAAIADGVRGAEELVAYRCVDAYAARLQAMQSRLLRAQRRLRRSAALTTALIGLLGDLAVVLALALAIPLLRQGRLPGWDLAVLGLVALGSFEAAQPLPEALQSLSRCLAAGRRILAVADEAPDIEQEEEGRTPEGSRIEFDGVEVRYSGSAAPALRDIDLNLAPGRHVGLVGASGAGKTSLLAALSGFAPCGAGTLHLGGVPLRQVAREKLWSEMALIGQDTTLFNASLRENILLGRPEAALDDVLAAVRSAGLEPLVASLPDGLETRIGEQGARLSGGERQRVAIARALLKDAPILLADEPTEGLDAITAAAVLRELLRLAQGRTLLLATHHLLGLEEMDEVVVLSGGRIVERGRHDELRRTGGPYARLLSLQLDRLSSA